MKTAVASQLRAPKPIEMMGVSAHPLTISDLNNVIGAAVDANERWIIAHHNLHSLYLHRVDPSMRDFYAMVHFAHIDGMPLVTIGRWMGHPLRREQRVTYVDWTGPLMTEAAARGWRIFYLGSRPGVAGRGAEVLRGLYPGLQVETADGYFDAAPESPDNLRVLERINVFRPNILMVGMGMPRQERWIQQNFERLATNVVLPCGACIDYVAGAIPTPPRWMGQLGIEWLYRLGSEPKRLCRRYLLEPWYLLPLLFRDLRSVRQRSRAGTITLDTLPGEIHRD
jgi:N-acetylglucosaminyldiphosphoundecaprenol N-acetyl-beta-D-mannosaminyltransferase